MGPDLPAVRLFRTSAWANEWIQRCGGRGDFGGIDVQVAAGRHVGGHRSYRVVGQSTAEQGQPRDKVGPRPALAVSGADDSVERGDQTAHWHPTNPSRRHVRRRTSAMAKPYAP